MHTADLIDQVNDALFAFGSNTRICITVRPDPLDDRKDISEIQAFDINDDRLDDVWLGPKERGAAQ